MKRSFALALVVWLAACGGSSTTGSPSGPSPGASEAAAAAADGSPVLSIDPRIKTGKLKNGLTYYVLKAMSWAGLVWDLKAMPASMRNARPQRQ